MQMFLRLHDPADADLIYLRYRYGKRFPGIVRKCLRAHVERDLTGKRPDDGFVITFSGRKIRTFAKHPTEAVGVNLNLKTGRDDDLIGYLSGIRDFAKSDVVKTIVRSRYGEFPFQLFRSPYIDGLEDDSSFVESGVRVVRNDSEESVESTGKDEIRNETEVEDVEAASKDEPTASASETSKTKSNVRSEKSGGKKLEISRKRSVAEYERTSDSENRPHALETKSSETGSKPEPVVERKPVEETKPVSEPNPSSETKKPERRPTDAASVEDANDVFSMLEGMMNH